MWQVSIIARTAGRAVQQGEVRLNPDPAHSNGCDIP
jgi:hypothetical protein